jgi:hypothetical protein
VTARPAAGDPAARPARPAAVIRSLGGRSPRRWLARWRLVLAVAMARAGGGLRPWRWLVLAVVAACGRRWWRLAGGGGGGLRAAVVAVAACERRRLAPGKIGVCRQGPECAHRFAGGGRSWQRARPALRCPLCGTRSAQDRRLPAGRGVRSRETPGNADHDARYHGRIALRRPIRHSGARCSLFGVR